LDILNPANILAREIIQHPTTALFRKQCHKNTCLFGTHFFAVGQKIGMLFQNIHNDGQGLFAAHALLALGRFQFQCVKHIDIRPRIPTCQDAEQPRAHLPEEFNGQ
jgi:hypothetical protein